MKASNRLVDLTLRIISLRDFGELLYNPWNLYCPLYPVLMLSASHISSLIAENERANRT